MENIKVGDVVFTDGTGDYETKLCAVVLINNKKAYIFNDTGSNYLRCNFEEYLEGNYVKEKKVIEPIEPEFEELTVSEISEKLGKKIKVVAEKTNNDEIPF